jgi:formimidoylglutamate deiminase
MAAGVSLALGSDSQAHIDLLDEARQLEGHLRLLRLRRNVLAPHAGDEGGLGARLLDVLAAGGARSLGLAGAPLAPGRAADFCTLDLQHPALAGAPPSLLAALALAAPSAAVREVCVAGRLIVREGRHPQADATASGFLDALRRLGLR